ncbi:MAG: hypothetical protein H6581_07855 [Bacteroidia bacterium]|nr:hypothetical protein [Bacteroidia bacterium]
MENSWEEAIERKALEILTQRPRKGLQLIHKPASGDYSAVTISMDRKGRLKCFRRTWKRRYDLDPNNFERALATYLYFDKNPLVTYHTFGVEEEEFFKLYQQATRTPMPLDPESTSWGIDGVVYELWIGEPFSGINLRWWWKLPEKWMHLKPLVDYLLIASEIRELPQEEE